MNNRYAIIEDGLVKNVVVADAEFAAQQGWIDCPQASPGWNYSNGVFTEPPFSPTSIPMTTPTKEQLLAQLQALQVQIQALE